MRILYVQATLVPPPVELTKDRFTFLSDELEGEILQPVWFRRPDEIEAIFGPGSWPSRRVGRFQYHWFLAYRGQRPKVRLSVFWFYLRTGLRLHRERKFDCIVVYSHQTTALCGLLLKLLTGVKLIPEVMTAPDKAYLSESASPRIVDRLKHLYSDICLYLTVGLSDCAHLLYPWQLASYRLLRSKRTAVFHDFTPLSAVLQSGRADANEIYILLAGSPWYIKGADRAVAAFRNLAPDFPDVRLKLVGHYPEGTLQALAAGEPQIEVMQAVPHEQMMRIVSGASIMLLPSRMEGLPRILLEGLAAGLPLVGSDVAGIPWLIRDGENGYVIPGGDVRLLEQRLRELLSDPHLRRRMGQRSRELAQSFTDAVYTQKFTRMIQQTVGPSPLPAGGSLVA